MMLMKTINAVIFILFFVLSAAAAEEPAVFENGKALKKSGGFYLQDGKQLGDEAVEKGLLGVAAQNSLMSEAVECRNKAWVLAGTGLAATGGSVLTFSMLPKNSGSLDEVSDYVGNFIIGSALAGLAVIAEIAAIVYACQSNDSFNKAVDEYNKELMPEGVKTGAMLMNDMMLISVRMDF
jgi:hypothetical protein